MLDRAHAVRIADAARRAARGLAAGACLPVLAAGACAPARTADTTWVRPPAVAGTFYPGEPAGLERAGRELLAGAVPRRPEPPVALVLPHAGWAFSGQIAADGWAQAAGRPYDVVVILGTNHTAARFDRVAVWPRGGFRTPLGVAPVDTAAAEALIAADPDCVIDEDAHGREHSVEVHVPFAQLALPGTPILPLVVACQDSGRCRRLGRALARILHGRRALVVASSDLSHYPAYDDARASDGAVLAAIASVDPDAFRATIEAQMQAGRPALATCACGEAPVMAALEAARAMGATRGAVLSAANSGDTPIGDRDRVVGYGAVAFYAPSAAPGHSPATTAGAPSAGTPASASHGTPAPLTAAPPEAGLSAEDQARLLAFARLTLQRWFETGVPPLARDLGEAAERPQGAFVTLRIGGELRGCIGHMAPDLPLGQAVGMMALAAALRDPRFPPLEASELERVTIEISALTPLERVAGPEAIVVGRDGVEIRKAGRVAVFLPQVAGEQGWDRTALLENLCLKAGLPRDGWRGGAELWTFRAIHFRETGTR